MPRVRGLRARRTVMKIGTWLVLTGASALLGACSGKTILGTGNGGAAGGGTNAGGSAVGGEAGDTAVPPGGSGGAPLGGAGNGMGGAGGFAGLPQLPLQEVDG